MDRESKQILSIGRLSLSSQNQVADNEVLSQASHAKLTQTDSEHPRPQASSCANEC